MLSRKPWLPELVIMFLGAIFMGAMLANLTALILHSQHVAGFRESGDIGIILCGSLGIQGITWILIPIFLKMNETTIRDGFGLDKPGWPNSVLLAAGLIILILPGIWCLQALSGYVLTHMGWPPSNQAAIDAFLRNTTIGARCYMIFFAVLLAPVAEEFIFRGVMYPFAKQFMPRPVAFVGVSAVFAAIHFDVGTFLPLFILAMFLTWLYEKTECLLACMTAHALFNSANLVMLFFLPQINDALEKAGHAPLSQ